MEQSAIQNSVSELIDLVENGKALEAFDKFYHDEIVAQENHTEPRVGKAVNRQYEVDFLNNLQEVRTYKAVSTMVGTNVSAIAWELDLDHKEWGSMQMTEINLQEWEDGKIVRETYYYKP